MLFRGVKMGMEVGKSLVFVLIFDHSTILTDSKEPNREWFMISHICIIFHVYSPFLKDGARLREAIKTVVKTDFAHLEQPLSS